MGDRLSGKRALITGGGSGLGAEMARMFVGEGARVAVTDINAPAAEEVAAEINARAPGAAFAYAHDVRLEADWISVLDRAAGDLGGLNVLVNNAGIGSAVDIEHETFEEWRRVQEIDVDSVFLGCKYALRYMKESQPGSIINVSSIAGLIAGHNMAAYNAAKAAVWLLSKSVALHCAKAGYDIRSNSIHPVFVRTPILKGFAPGGDAAALDAQLTKLARQIPLGRIGEPSDVGYCAIYLASDESRFVTGAEFKIDGGISAM